MNHIDLIIPIVAPLLAAAISLSVGWRTVTKWANSLAAVTILGTGLLFAFGTRSRHVELFDGLLRSDPLSSLLLIAIGAVGSLVTVSSVDYIERELSVGATDRSDARQYATLVPLFLTTMVVVVLSNNLGLIWIAIEATTITTAFLVGHHRTRLSLEATWKYVVICSFGITLAFLGTVLLYFASVHSGSSPADALNLDTLVRRAGRMDKTVTRLAMGLLLIGFGTKAGLFPFHTGCPARKRWTAVKRSPSSVQLTRASRNPALNNSRAWDSSSDPLTYFALLFKPTCLPAAEKRSGLIIAPQQPQPMKPDSKMDLRRVLQTGKLTVRASV